MDDNCRAPLEDKTNTCKKDNVTLYQILHGMYYVYVNWY
jgi:hypothetical protein